MRKSIHFPEHPFFMPMYNPKEMLEAGIFEGFLNSPHNAKHFELQKMGFLLETYHPIRYQFSRESLHNEEHHLKYLSPPEFSTELLDFSKRVEWFMWYCGFYMGLNTDPAKDRAMITQWVHTSYKLYDEIIMVDESNNPKDSDKLLLLELALHWKYYPNLNFSKEWMLKRYPLPQ